MSSPDHVPLMAAVELRTALEAHRDGDVPGMVTALLSIDPQSWQAIERRLKLLDCGSVNELLAGIERQQQQS